MREIWRATVFLWQTLCGSLIPARPARMPELLARFLEHLGRTKERSRPRSADRILEILGRKRG